MYTENWWRKQRGNKYHAKGQNYDGRYFHSLFEIHVYQDLQWRQKAGEISEIECQHKIDIKVNGIHITNYYIDFMVTYPDGSKEYIEAKGFETTDWRIKWNLVNALQQELLGGADLTLIKQSKSKYYRKIN